MLLQQLDLSGLEGWSGANNMSAHALLTEYHDIFLLEPGEFLVRAWQSMRSGLLVMNPLRRDFSRFLLQWWRK